MSSRAPKVSKKQRRVNGQQAQIPSLSSQHFDLRSIYPLNDNQEKVFNHYDDGDNLFLLGCAGTGKSYVSIYLALKEILDMLTPRNKVVIIRSTQPSRQQGFLPGDEKQKAAVYETPYKGICADLFHRDDAYEILKKKGIVNFETTSYLRGTTIDDAIILVDEAQNMVYQELRTILTRVGENSRLIICGDTKQDDLTSARYQEESGLPVLMKVLREMNCMSSVFFGIEDIVRSGFVKDFLETEYKLGL